MYSYVRICPWTVPHSPPHYLKSVTQLLSKPKFCSVEKIKTIGSTYMAAAGLRHTPPGDERKVCSPASKHCHPLLMGSYQK